MADVFSKQERSSIMRKVLGKHTKPEIIVRKYLSSQKIKYRLHSKKLPGKPDIIIPSKKIAILINGCFWHGHTGCKNSVLPKSNRIYWEEKIGRNKLRDRRNLRALKKEDWRVIVIWECKLSNDRARINSFQRLANFIEG
jgi:DNA mismatch endonuclease (patch repair protein)